MNNLINLSLSLLVVFLVIHSVSYKSFGFFTLVFIFIFLFLTVVFISSSVHSLSEMLAQEVLDRTQRRKDLLVCFIAVVGLLLAIVEVGLSFSLTLSTPLNMGRCNDTAVSSGKGWNKTKRRTVPCNRKH